MGTTGQFYAGHVKSAGECGTETTGLLDMAEAAKEAPKKKGKLPIIIAVVALLAGGGYMMMSKGGDKKEEEPEIALAHSAEQIGEFLLNLKDGSYLSTTVAVQTAEGTSVSSGGDGHGKAGEPYPWVKDAIIQVLSQKSSADLSSLEGKRMARREIAYAINHAAHLYKHEEGDKKSSKKKKKDKDKDDHASGTPDELKPDYEPEYPEWDSDEGPVLKVWFLTFTTQR